MDSFWCWCFISATEIFFMCFFLFLLIPFHCSSLLPIQSSFSKHKLPCLPLQTWLLLDLSCGLASYFPPPLYQALIFHPCLQHFWFLLLSSLLFLSPVVLEVIFSEIPTLCFFFLKTTAFHRKYREEGLLSSGFPAMLAGCLPMFFQPALEILTGIKNAFAFSKCKS